jgi:hypothetical protein
MYVTAGGDGSWRPSLRYTVPMIAFWLLVLLGTIYFATRRRAIQPRRVFADTEPDTAMAGA